MTAGWLALFWAMSVCTLAVPVSGNMENKLIRDLLNTYAKTARPLKSSSDILNITYGLPFISIDVDEQAQILTTIGYDSLTWHDHFLVWDPEEYGGIEETFLDERNIWIPDITLYNAVGEVDVQYGQGNALINFQGEVMLIRISKSKVNCDFDSLQFPFDTVKCTMTYGSWVYSGFKVNLTLADKSVDLSNFQPNPTWGLKDAKVEKSTLLYPCCPEPYYTIVYTIEFFRRSTHYVQILLVPSFLLSILTILLFMLPTHSSERVTLGVLLFCAFFTLLLYTSSLVPGWHHLPFFVIFLIFNLVLITVVTFLNSVIVRLSNSERGREVPKILRAVMFELLARLFCMKSIVERNRSRHLVAPEYESQTQQGNYDKLPMTSEKLPLDPATKGDSIDDLPEVELPQNGKQSFEADVAFIRAFARRSWQKMKNGDWEKKLFREWKDVAKVINRLFFIIYMLVVSIAIGIVLIQISAK